jgi:murein DD-endopeptidase MepM/ murein hydrolase activator NlpD
MQSHHKKASKKNIVLIVITIIIALMMLLSGLSFLARAQTVATGDAPSSTPPQTLQDQINQKSKELQAVNDQINTAKASLKATDSQRVTLQQQLGVITSNINTLTLGIKADELNTQQLALEIQQLGGDIQAINDSIDVKQAAIGSLIQQIAVQESSDQMPLAILLKDGTLADSVMEAQNVHNLQSQLLQDIGDLKSLQDQYHQKIQDSATKKDDVTAHESDLQNKQLIVKDQQVTKQALLVSTKNQESIFQKQLTVLQQQQEDINSEMEALESVLRTKIDPSTLPAATAGVLAVPVLGDDKSDITQGYGATDFAKTAYKDHWHNGVDLAAAVGTPLVASEDGTVAAVGNNDKYCPKGAYGKFVVINFNDNLTGLYGHLSRQLVAAGDTVKRGQVIGYSGQTGYATGPHLHFSIFATPTFYMSQSKYCGPMPVGGDIDPIPYLF